MQQIADYGHDTAENILWHPEENALYWLDIPTGQFFRGYFPNLKQEDLSEFHSECILQMDEPIGGFVFCDAGGLANSAANLSCEAAFLLFASGGRIYEWQYSGQGSAKPKLYAQVDSVDWVPSRFNDVFAWPSRSTERLVLCGTMPTEGNADSRLLLFDVQTRTARPVLENQKLANGMGLSPDRSHFYFADTRDFAVYRFAVSSNEPNNEQSNAQSEVQIDWQSPHKLIDFTGRPGRPDGLCVDKAGRIWLAETGAGQVTCFSAQGQELAALEVGTPKVTSCCFGGSAQDILFVSTQGGKAGGKAQAGEKAGGIFAQKLGAQKLGTQKLGTQKLGTQKQETQKQETQKLENMQSIQGSARGQEEFLL